MFPEVIANQRRSSTEIPETSWNMITNESAAALCEIAWAHLKTGRRVPDHLLADLRDVAWCDSIALRLRESARHLILEAA